MDNKHGRASKIRFNKRHKRKHSNKTVDRLLYDPLKHKQEFKKSLRKELQKKRNNSSSVHSPSSQIMKFGSMNVQGLDFETNLAIQSIINEYNHDVSIVTIGDKDKDQADLGQAQPKLSLRLK